MPYLSPAALHPFHRDSDATLLVVSADAARLADALGGDDDAIRVASDAREALRHLAAGPASVLLVADGLDVDTLLAAARRANPHAQLVLRGDAAPSPRAAALGAHGWVASDDAPARLRLAIDAAGRTAALLTAAARRERRKTDLLASVSHELRTPINVVLGYVDLLVENTFGACPPEARAVLEKVRGNAAWLLELVEELLELAQLEAGAAAVRCMALDPTPLLRELGDALALLAAPKGLTPICALPPRLPLVLADAARLRVVVQNLLANATKFTEHGHVRLSAAASDAGGVTVVVTDSGPGIPPEQLEAVFDPYHQLEPYRGPRRGIGLGLALARRFARAMGGDLVAASTPGAGATFTLVLAPATAPDTAVALGAA